MIFIAAGIVQTSYCKGAMCSGPLSRVHPALLFQRSPRHCPTLRDPGVAHGNRNLLLSHNLGKGSLLLPSLRDAGISEMGDGLETLLCDGLVLAWHDY